MSHDDVLRAQERMQRNQMVGNAVVSTMQALAASRPIQVGLGMGILQLLASVGDDGESLVEQAGETLIAGGMAGYLANSDGGISLAFDVPDVQSPSPIGPAVGGGGSPLSPP